MSGRGRVLLGLALAGGLLPAVAGGCGDDSRPRPMMLLTAAYWNDDPSSLADIGYEVHVDIGWQERAMSCFDLSPALRVTVNDRATGPIIVGECQWDFLVEARGFRDNGPVTVKLHDGDALLGEATYQDLFAGFTTSQSLPPPKSTVQPGETFVVSVTEPISPAFRTVAVQFYWLDTPASVPPFYTWVSGKVSADALSVEVVAPAITGRALMIIGLPGGRAYEVTTACTGFSTCYYWADHDTFGPMPIEVVE